MNYSFFRKNAEKVRREMRKEGIDVCVLTFQQKISYVAGTYHNDWNAGNCVFLWAEEEPTLLVSVSEKGRLMFEGYIKDVQFWNPAFYGVAPSAFAVRAVEILQEHNMASAMIAVEEPSISWRVYNALRRELPDAKFLDCEDMLNQIMMIKDEEEIELTRRVCAIADAGTQAILDHARVGVTESELIGYAEREMRRLGCSYYYTPNQCNFDNRVICDHIPTDRILRADDKITYDLHPVFHEYRADYFRTISLGEPEPEYRKMADFITDLAFQLNDKLVPGASTNEIEIWFRERVKEKGYPDRAMKDIGHGIGTGHLPPFFTLDRDWILQENMVVSICPYIYDPGNYNLLMEYCVLIRKGRGPEVLNRHPLGLLQV